MTISLKAEISHIWDDSRIYPSFYMNQNHDNLHKCAKKISDYTSTQLIHLRMCRNNPKLHIQKNQPTRAFKDQGSKKAPPNTQIESIASEPIVTTLLNVETATVPPCYVARECNCFWLIYRDCRHPEWQSGNICIRAYVSRIYIQKVSVLCTLYIYIHMLKYAYVSIVLCMYDNDRYIVYRCVQGVGHGHYLVYCSNPLKSVFYFVFQV